MSLALELYEPVCLRCGGALLTMAWDQPSLLRHGWWTRPDFHEPLDQHVTVRYCPACGASRRPDVRATAVRH